MFRQLKNIDSAFKHVKLFSFFIVCASLILCGFTIYTSVRKIGEIQSKIYVLYNNQLLAATAQDRQNNIPVILRDQVKTFHYWFFTLDPDDKENTAHLTTALYLADGSAKTVYDNLKENGFYSGVVTGNISQRIETDSVSIDLNQDPYCFRYYGKVVITRPTSIVTRSLTTDGTLRQVSQSDNNPNGFLIEKWQILDNHDLNIKQR